MIRYAITPKGVGRSPGIRAIKDTWDLRENETFSVLDYMPGQVLAEDGVHLRDKTPEEKSLEVTVRTVRETEESEIAGIVSDTKAGPLFDALKRATPAQINTMIENQFDTFTPQQQNVLKFLLRIAMVTIRKLR